jgi:hypothetical protein
MTTGETYDHAIEVLAQVLLCVPSSLGYQKAQLAVAALDEAGLAIVRKTEIVVTLRLDATQALAELLQSVQQLRDA